MGKSEKIHISGNLTIFEALDMIHKELVESGITRVYGPTLYFGIADTCKIKTTEVIALEEPTPRRRRR